MISVGRNKMKPILICCFKVMNEQILVRVKTVNGYLPIFRLKIRVYTSGINRLSDGHRDIIICLFIGRSQIKTLSKIETIDAFV